MAKRETHRLPCCERQVHLERRQHPRSLTPRTWRSQAGLAGAFRDTYQRAKPTMALEPVMKVSVEGPSEFQGGVVRTLMQRRGMVTATVEEDGFCRIEADVPLAEMFAYLNVLRSATQGKAESLWSSKSTLEYPMKCPRH